MIPASPFVRWAGAIALFLFSLHLLGQLFSPRYAHHTSLDSAKARFGLKERPAEEWYRGNRVYPWDERPDPVSELSREEWDRNQTAKEGDERVKAAFVVLVRESDLYEILPSIQQVEDRFNKRYHYPWIFLNDGDFSDDFKRRTSTLASGETKYGKVPEEHWGKGMPEGINQTLAMEKIQAMGKLPIPYGGSVPYRKMCRYQSGFFWRHPLLDEYEYYWRVEPSVKFFCDIPYDVFKVMKEGNKKYGFTVSLYEYRETIASLWDTTKDFIEQHPEHIPENNLMEWISPNGGKDYNLCHFWSNFEIAALDLWRSPAYRTYFDFLDKSGGFFYERWGDAPVHSIAAALFLNSTEFHFFQDIGYRHEPFQHCPQPGRGDRCTCNPRQEENFEFHGYSCTARWKQVTGWSKDNPFVHDG
ncbi:hypothetical protein JCM11251_004480 [Rhodosporidiobolus azoricus]